MNLRRSFTAGIVMVLASVTAVAVAQHASFRDELKASLPRREEPLPWALRAIAQDEATVYVFRQEQFAASASDLAIQADGEMVGWLRGGEYLKLGLPPGQHIVAATLVRKGEDAYSWYAEYWPLSIVTPEESGRGTTISTWDQALLSLSPDVALRQPYIAEQYKHVLATAMADTVIRKMTHQGVLTRGSDQWVWAEGQSRADLEAGLDELFDSIGQKRETFWPRIAPSRFKRSRRTELVRVVAEPGQQYFLYLRYMRTRPWALLSLEESLAEFGDSVRASSERYGPEWRVGEKFLKNQGQ